MTQQVITAFFNSRDDAMNAVEELVRAGVPRASVRLLPEHEADSSSRTTQGAYDYNRDDQGFWASLADFFFPDEDRYTYAEAMNRGSIMVTATVDAAHADRAADILDEYGTVDIDEQEQTWRKQGWSGYSAGTMGTGASTTSRASMGSGAGMASGTAAAGTGAGMASRSSMTSATSHTATTGGTEAIPIVEEQLHVGKRQVNKGRVRIRSYVVETPVREQVNLRQEHVHVERRPVNRPVTSADQALFRERTIEAEERGEEAVVSKEARVKEELVVKKDVEERTQTVQDKVRRTEVDIDDKRAGQSTKGSGASTPRR